jgi:hypothetical protein
LIKKTETVFPRPQNKNPGFPGLLNLMLSSDVFLFPDTGRLAAKLPQIVELGATDLTAGYHFDCFHYRGMQRETPFNADTVGNFAHRE